MNEIIEILTLKNVFRVFFFVIMFGYLIYAWLLSLRIRILAQTLKTKISSTIQLVSWMHFILVVFLCLIIGIMILQ